MGPSYRTTRKNHEWIAALRNETREQDQVLSELRTFLHRGLHAAFRSRSDVREEQVEDWVQDSVLRIMNKLDSFRGESRFTTWAMRIAINVAYSDLRRARYSDVSLDAIRVPRQLLPARRAARKVDQPAQRAQKRAVVKTLNRIMKRELTGAQQKVFYAVQIQQIPLSELARRLDISRGTLYKRMHDARKRIKRAMEEAGYSYEECARVFDGD